MPVDTQVPTDTRRRRWSRWRSGLGDRVLAACEYGVLGLTLWILTWEEPESRQVALSATRVLTDLLRDTRSRLTAR